MNFLVKQRATVYRTVVNLNEWQTRHYKFFSREIIRPIYDS